MIRVGTGYDIHRLVEGRPLILGGETIPFEKGLDAHSDGDVVAHAITDALLGAAGLGNIGQRFPDTDPEYARANSLELLKQVKNLMLQQGYEIINVDATIIAQAPKLNPHIDDMRSNLALALGMDRNFVSVKPKTNEGVGPEGRGEAISVHAIAAIERADHGRRDASKMRDRVRASLRARGQKRSTYD